MSIFAHKARVWNLAQEPHYSLLVLIEVLNEMETWVGFSYYHQITDSPLSSLNYDYGFGTCLTEISKKKRGEKKKKQKFFFFSGSVACIQQNLSHFWVSC